MTLTDRVENILNSLYYSTTVVWPETPGSGPAYTHYRRFPSRVSILQLCFAVPLAKTRVWAPEGISAGIAGTRQ